jgi:hypothetical protein
VGKCYDVPRVVLKLEGGMVHTAENAHGVDVVLIDYDTDGVPSEGLCGCHLAGANKRHIHRVMEKTGIWTALEGRA